MNIKVWLVCVLTLSLLQTTFGQNAPVAPEVQQSGYLVGPGDEITGKVLGEPQFDFVATIDEDGKFQVPFFDKPIQAKCRTEKDLRTDVVQLLAKYLKSPQISVRVTQRKSRPPATVYGEVRTQQQVDLRREARLLELISFAGGETEKASGMVQVFRTQPLMCAESNDKDNWMSDINSRTEVPSRLYSLTSLRSGRDEANPSVYPGDLVMVLKAPPIYVIGEVNVLKEIPLTGNGLSLTEAIAQSGGFSRDARTKMVTIRRLKANSKDREIIAVNFDQIKKGTQKDVVLEPFDIVEVDKSKKSIGQTILEIATGSVKNFSQVLPQRILY
ncbi:MAG: SLBB domain-containing protein [Acidobacteriota bacterium]|jgi:polysaccharide export outer membrane protein|nr:SLBB domain-containing protein [Acidobacteriota bacterium]